MVLMTQFLNILLNMICNNYMSSPRIMDMTSIRHTIRNHIHHIIQNHIHHTIQNGQQKLSILLINLLNMTISLECSQSLKLHQSLLTLKQQLKPRQRQLHCLQ